MPVPFLAARVHLLATLHSSPPSLRGVSQLFGRAVVLGLLRDPFASARLAAAAAPLDLRLAELAFRYASPAPSAFAFATLIRARSAGPDPALALRLFVEMLRRGLYPDRFAFPFLLRASARAGSHSTSLALHALAFGHGLATDPNVATSLLHAYGASGLVDDAVKVLEEMPHRTTVTYNAIMSACGRSPWGSHGLCLFVEMLSSGTLEPNADTFVAALMCCATLGALTHGRAVHALALRRLPGQFSAEKGTSLIQMYGKCGSLEAARKLFDEMPSRDDTSMWTALIGGLAMHARGEEAVALFERMVAEGVAPDSMAFTSVLHACSHSGLVETGIRLFNDMKGLYGIEPRMEHYGTMVDLFSRAGRLEEAERVVASMPFEPNQVVWGSLLHACAVNGGMASREQLGRRLLELGIGAEGGEEGGFYVGVSNVYAGVGRWEEVGKVRERMVGRGVRKDKGFSFVEVNGRVHKFLVGGTTHPSTMEIYRLLQRINEEMIFEGR